MNAGFVVCRIAAVAIVVVVLVFRTMDPMFAALGLFASSVEMVVFAVRRGNDSWLVASIVMALLTNPISFAFLHPPVGVAVVCLSALAILMSLVLHAEPARDLLQQILGSRALYVASPVIVTFAILAVFLLVGASGARMVTRTTQLTVTAVAFLVVALEKALFIAHVTRLQAGRWVKIGWSTAIILLTPWAELMYLLSYVLNEEPGVAPPAPTAPVT